RPPGATGTAHAAGRAGGPGGLCLHLLTGPCLLPITELPRRAPQVVEALDPVPDPLRSQLQPGADDGGTARLTQPRGRGHLVAEFLVEQDEVEQPVALRGRDVRPVQHPHLDATVLVLLAHRRHLIRGGWLTVGDHYEDPPDAHAPAHRLPLELEIALTEVTHPQPSVHPSPAAAID